jgi:DNA-binding transcriptional LysR family regulator
MMIKRFDLNLVRIFCTIYDTGSLTLTAEILDITQPAISHALKKMRIYYDDPLFVRSEGKMIPTQLANSISPNLKKSMELINLSLQVHTFFSNPESSKKCFVLSMSDMSQTFFIPPLCLAMEDMLDQVHLDIIQVRQDKIERIMRLGELDFALGNLPLLDTLEGKIVYEPLFEDRFVCMIRDGHPMAENKNSTFDISKLKLLSIQNKITGHTRLLEKINTTFSDNIIITIPNFTVAPEIISKTDFGVIIPISIAKRYNTDNQFIIHEIDFPENRIEVKIYYHKLYENDPSIKWMKQIFIEHFQENQPE